MPLIDVAMERSLRRGFLDLLVASLRPALERRGLQDQITDVKTAFSSWDNCMQANYCKWPVIALIIIGGLIIFSVVWCIVRCACCGLSCCCSCFSCLKCCGNCCGCCDPPRGSRRKYLDEPYIPPHQGYKAQEPMHAGFGPSTAAATKGASFPQYAEFDVGGKKNEDALPEMPSWDGAERKKVLVEEEVVEMDALKKPKTGGQAAGAAATGATGAAMPVSPNGSRSPVNRSPYGPPGVGPGSNGYFAVGAADSDPYAQGAPSYNQPGLGYSESDLGHGVAGATMGPGRRSPHPYNNASYNTGYNSSNYGQTHDYPPAAGQGGYSNNYAATGQQPYDSHDDYTAQTSQGYGIPRQQTPHEMDATPYAAESRRSPAPQGPYGSRPRRSPGPQGQYGGYGPEPRRSPAPQGPYGRPAYGADPRRSPAPQGDYGSGGYDTRGGGSGRPGGGGYGEPRSPPQRQFSSSSYNNRSNNASPAPGGFSSNGPAGFDFTSGGYSRPPPAASPSSPVNGGAGGYRLPSPSADGHRQQQGYPGYKPYQPGA